MPLAPHSENRHRPALGLNHWPPAEQQPPPPAPGPGPRLEARGGPVQAASPSTYVGQRAWAQGRRSGMTCLGGPHADDAADGLGRRPEPADGPSPLRAVSGRRRQVVRLAAPDGAGRSLRRSCSHRAGRTAWRVTGGRQGSVIGQAAAAAAAGALVACTASAHICAESGSPPLGNRLPGPSGDRSGRQRLVRQPIATRITSVRLPALLRSRHWGRYRLRWLATRGDAGRRRPGWASHPLPTSGRP